MYVIWLRWKAHDAIGCEDMGTHMGHHSQGAIPQKALTTFVLIIYKENIFIGRYLITSLTSKNLCGLFSSQDCFPAESTLLEK